ncbi:hypothetical protein NQ317_006105 [Molorchus minor]|uniref:Uncharacterized protein n=1 Tax=Molorchus minor TaxID=1323400 RepID=A0ABQ9IQW1_9CUCU|nr:hypothetical protein NQ317_006105 [Molorchus minor]
MTETNNNTENIEEKNRPNWQTIIRRCTIYDEEYSDCTSYELDLISTSFMENHRLRPMEKEIR